jgi:IS5 family transposase
MYSKKYNKDIASIMAICDSGFGSKLVAQEIVVTVSENHPLIILANALPWEKMLQLIEHDLKQTTPLKRGHYGRKLKVRIHLGAYLLQKMHDLTDRAIEAAIRDGYSRYLMLDRPANPA